MVHSLKLAFKVCTNMLVSNYDEDHLSVVLPTETTQSVCHQSPLHSTRCIHQKC